MRIVICDDHRLLLEALSSALATSGHVVEAAVTTPEDALVAVRTHQPDVVLMDVCFGDRDSLETARDLVQGHPHSKLVLLTASDSLHPLRVALDIGAAGYVRKDARIPQILAALERVGRGERAFDDVLVMQLARAPASRRTRSVVDGLTTREKDVVVLLQEGLDTRQITSRLGISTSTARTHIQAILSKLGVHSRVQAVAALGQADRM